MKCPEIELVVSNIDIKTSFAAPRRQVYASKYFSTLYFAPLSSPLSLIQISLLSYPSTRVSKKRGLTNSRDALRSTTPPIFLHNLDLGAYFSLKFNIRLLII
jgi:hypothetical protein